MDLHPYNTERHDITRHDTNGKWKAYTSVDWI
jgi:hypothetical protein